MTNVVSSTPYALSNSRQARHRSGIRDHRQDSAMLTRASDAWAASDRGSSALSDVTRPSVLHERFAESLCPPDLEWDQTTNKEVMTPRTREAFLNNWYADRIISECEHDLQKQRSKRSRVTSPLHYSSHYNDGGINDLDDVLHISRFNSAAKEAITARDWFNSSTPTIRGIIQSQYPLGAVLDSPYWQGINDSRPKSELSMRCPLSYGNDIYSSNINATTQVEVHGKGECKPNSAYPCCNTSFHERGNWIRLYFSLIDSDKTRLVFRIRRRSPFVLAMEAIAARLGFGGPQNVVLRRRSVVVTKPAVVGHELADDGGLGNEDCGDCVINYNDTAEGMGLQAGEPIFVLPDPDYASAIHTM